MLFCVSFHRLVTTVLVFWMIEKTKHICSNRDINSNQGHQYAAELESFEFQILVTIKFSNIQTLCRVIMLVLLTWMLRYSVFSEFDFVFQSDILVV